MKNKAILFLLFSLIFSSIYAQEEVRSGRIVYVPEFAVWGTVGDGQACAVFGLETNSETYVLTADNVFLFGKGNFEAVGQACSIGDSVEISGYIHSVSDDDKAFTAFEIKSINILDTFSPEKISGTYTGRLVSMPNPATEIPVMPGLVVGLECNGNQYILSKKGWQDDYVEAGGVRYEMGDSVEIEGVVSTHIDLLNRTYFELEIDTIRKIVPLSQEEDYLPEGKVWTMLSVEGPARWTYTVSVFGEVERGGHIWKRSRTDELEFLLHRQEGKKIWAMCPYDDGGMDTVPFLMFDFGLKKGDTAHLYVDTTQHRDDAWIVESVFDSVFETGQKARHCQRVYLVRYPEVKDVWVEGVGSLTNGLTYSPAGFLRGPSELICVQKATGDVVYQNKKYHSCDGVEDFFQEGKSWSVVPIGWPPVLDSGYTIRNSENMRVEGEVDTLGFLWKRVVYDNSNKPFLYRQDGQKIYGYNELDSIYLHFDFELQKGDTVLTYTYMPDYYVVDSVFVSTFGQDARKRKCLAMQSLALERVKDVWVEGIGSLSAGMLYNHSRRSGKLELLCVEENGINLYRNPEYNTCRVPAHRSYDYSVQKWSVLCREANDARHTELLYFKENGKKKWNRAYRTTREDFSDEKPFGWYYQDILQVYFKEMESDIAVLLYDFGLEKGESVLGAGGVLWVADSVYYNTGIRSLRMISESGDTDVWMEGIGSLKTGFLPAHHAGDFITTELLCTQVETSRGQVYTYQNERYKSCYITEETSTERTAAPCAVVQYDASRQSLVIESDVNLDRLEVFDARGRCVMKVERPAGSVSVARLPHGLYLYRLTAAGTTLSGKFVR